MPSHIPTYILDKNLPLAQCQITWMPPYIVIKDVLRHASWHKVLRDKYAFLPNILPNVVLVKIVYLFQSTQSPNHRDLVKVLIRKHESQKCIVSSPVVEHIRHLHELVGPCVVPTLALRYWSLTRKVNT